MSVFPPGLTEEEEYLLERFRILNEKKRALQKLKEKVELKVKPTIKRETQETCNTPEDAKKKAEMLVASGKVQISKMSVEREFKRARTSEKKVVKESLSDQESFTTVDKQLPSRTAMKDMYINSFVRGGKSENESDFSFGYSDNREPRRGNTIFIRGFGLKEDVVKTGFNKFGTVSETRYDKERRHGFVTFQTCEEAEKAIDEMNGTMVSGIHIEVSLARKQLHMDNARGDQPLWASRDISVCLICKYPEFMSHMHDLLEKYYRSRDRQESRTVEARELKTYQDDDFF